MLRRNELLIGFLLATAIWSVMFALQSDLTAYSEICEYNQTGQKDCASYHIILVALWHVKKFLNDTAVAITALATVAIAYFTLTLKRSTDHLWESSKTQLMLARDEFVSTHRPKMILRHIWICRQDGRFDPELSPDGPLCFMLDIRNIGSSSGWVRQGNFLVKILATVSSLPQRPAVVSIL